MFIKEPDLTVNPGGVIEVDSIDTAKLGASLAGVWVDASKLDTTVIWNTAARWEREHHGKTTMSETMDHTSRMIYKHWFDMFIKKYPEWNYALNADDPFYKWGGFRVTNGKYTITRSHPYNDLYVTPKLPNDRVMDSLGLDHTSFNMKSFIAWALGLEPLPKEIQ